MKPLVIVLAVIAYTVLLLHLFISIAADMQKLPPPSLPDPTHTVLIEGVKCLIYESRFQGSPIYTALCENGESYTTRNWLYISTIGQEPRSWN